MESLNCNILTFEDIKKTPVRILVLMATTAEYGAEMKDLGVNPSIIGVGPINAAINTTAILKDIQRTEELPDLIINMGSAGSRNLNYKTIAQASSISYRDMDARLFGFAKGQTPFGDLPANLPIQIRIPNLPVIAVSTGGDIISGEIAYKNIEYQAAEMEAYAVYSASIKFGIPMIKIVGISDGQKDITGNMEEWTKYLADIDHGFALTIEALKKNLEDGQLTKEDLRLPDTLYKQT